MFKPAKLMLSPLALSMLVATPVAIVVPTTAAYAGDAKQCVSLSGAYLVNTCNATITVTWCVEGLSIGCSRGYNAIWNIAARGRIQHGGPSTATVRWGACAGANTLTTHNYRMFEYGCTG